MPLPTVNISFHTVDPLISMAVVVSSTLTDTSAPLRFTMLLTATCPMLDAFSTKLHGANF